MDLMLKGRVAVVTGANRGIGLETCRQLLGGGLLVVMTGRDATALERARVKLRGATHGLQTDVPGFQELDVAEREVTGVWLTAVGSALTERRIVHREADQTHHRF